MRVVDDEAYRRFLAAADDPTWPGARIKDERSKPLQPGGRATVTLFEQAEDNGRAHPRFQVDLPPAKDPAPPERLFYSPATPPASAQQLREAVWQSFEAIRDQLRPGDDPSPPKGSEHYYRNSIRVQRTQQFFGEARGMLGFWVNEGKYPEGEVQAGRRAIRELEDLAYSGDIRFDDANTDTYHSFQHDAPFVHYLEKLLAALPAEDSQAFAVLPAEQQESLRRQRTQAQNHLDHLMLHKYAFDGIRETDIERSLGGLLIDRRSRRIVSETPESLPTLVPAYELLRIDPGANHTKRGEWVYRDGRSLRLQDGTAVEVPESMLRRAPIAVDQLTFRRAPKDRQLRANVRFPWEGRGYVQAGEVAWISWAGHCDIKAVMEQLGLALVGQPAVTELRAESGVEASYDRPLLIEMLASILELGSLYARADGTGELRRGLTRFGGARNDGRPDRLQLGATTGAFRFPRSGREESFVVKSIDWGQGAQSGDGLFLRSLPDLAKVDFVPNPRFRETTEGDVNLIDVAGALLLVDLQIDTIDAATGYPRRERATTKIDLRAAPTEKRSLLGTQIEGAAARRIRRFYLDREQNAVIGELEVYELQGGHWRARRLDDQTSRVELTTPLGATLGRELRAEDPAMFQTLVKAALRAAQNINADTDAAAEVWNGVVTRVDARRLDENRTAGVERWQIAFTARFGTATLDYLVRRDEKGEPKEFCPVLGASSFGGPPDFLWQDFPDIGSKGLEEGVWVVNATMVEREIVDLRHEPSVEGGFYVYDDHVKNLFEILYTALAGYRYSIVHNNKRYGFRDEPTYRRAAATLAALRGALQFT